MNSSACYPTLAAAGRFSPPSHADEAEPVTSGGSPRGKTDIARQAGVAAKTVYASAGGKADILSELNGCAHVVASLNPMEKLLPVPGLRGADGAPLVLGAAAPDPVRITVLKGP